MRRVEPPMAVGVAWSGELQVAQAMVDAVGAGGDGGPRFVARWRRARRHAAAWLDIGFQCNRVRSSRGRLMRRPRRRETTPSSCSPVCGNSLPHPRAADCS